MDRQDPEREEQRRPGRLFSSAEAREMLDEFRTLVRAGVLRVTADNDLVFVKPPGDWSRDWPRASDEELRKVDEQVFDWVRRNRERQESGDRKIDPAELPLGPLREQVIERLVEKILEQWESGRDRTLQDEVIERITARILKRWSVR